MADTKIKISKPSELKMSDKVMKADGNACPEREVWKESEQSFQAKYKFCGSFIYIKNSKVYTEEIYIKQ